MSSHVYLHVMVNLGDIDTVDLVDELKNRRDDGETDAVEEESDEDEKLKEISYALKFGMNDKCIELMRVFLNDKFGIIL